MKNFTKAQNMGFKSFRGKLGYLGWKNKEKIHQRCDLLDRVSEHGHVPLRDINFQITWKKLKKFNILLL